MTREEVSRRIHEITERMIKYSTEHADEIAQRTREYEAALPRRLETILDNAKRAVKRSDSVYASYRNQISALGLDSAEYESAVKRLAAILNY